MKAALVSTICALATSFVPLAASGLEGTRATLTLDQLSFISSSDGKVLAVPAGGTIGFRFGEVSSDGSRRIVVDPADVDLAPAKSADGSETIKYSLATPASGFIKDSESGATVVLNAQVRAQPIGGQAIDYSVRFTTESTGATAPNGQSIAVSGMRIVPGARYVQLVGATTNASDEESQPIHVVLSGTFDSLPLDAVGQ